MYNHGLMLPVYGHLRTGIAFTLVIVFIAYIIDEDTHRRIVIQNLTKHTSSRDQFIREWLDNLTIFNQHAGVYVQCEQFRCITSFFIGFILAGLSVGFDKHHCTTVSGIHSRQESVTA
jgi:hypothetical protein